MLDSVCPIPFPIFPDRTNYLRSLEEGRKEKDIFDSLKLCSLLLDSACPYFKMILSEEGVDDVVLVRSTVNRESHIKKHNLTSDEAEEQFKTKCEEVSVDDL